MAFTESANVFNVKWTNKTLINICRANPCIRWAVVVCKGVKEQPLNALGRFDILTTFLILKSTLICRLCL